MGKIDIKKLNELTKDGLPGIQKLSKMELKFIEYSIDHFLHGVATNSELSLLRDYELIIDESIDDIYKKYEDLKKA